MYPFTRVHVTALLQTQLFCNTACVISSSA